MKMYIVISFLICQTTFAEKKWISFDQNVKNSLSRSKIQELNISNIRKVNNITYAQIDKKMLPNLSKFIKTKLNRHGGFVQHSEKPDKKITSSRQKSWRELGLQYSINNQKQVNNAMGMLSEQNIAQDIIHLSSYHTRYHTSKEGLEAMQWIKQRWSKLTQHRNDVSIKLYNHSESPQPSVILTIKGKSDKRIILGGHADSINTDDEGPHSNAPGADDNAAGIGVLTELLRVLMDSNYKPNKTIEFIAYAAEEVGILGSYEIAKDYAKNKIEVDGVLQFDGVNYKGTSYDMALIDDYTSKGQNKFLAMLISEYLKVSWTYQSCGYGCSDHAAWNYEGYHASFPVETTADEQNPYQHTAEDTFDKSDNNALHALIFAKLGIAYTIELDNL